MEEEKEKTKEALNEEPGKFLHKIEIVMRIDGDIGLRTTTNNKAICKALLAGAEEILNQQRPSNIVIPQIHLGGKITGRG